MIGLTVRQYQRYEAGEQNPNLDNFCALADHFGVSLDYLAGRTDIREVAQEKMARHRRPIYSGHMVRAGRAGG